MQTQRERLTVLTNDTLRKVRLSDKCLIEVSGPQLVWAKDPEGNEGFTLGWQFTIWLEHNVLLGQAPVWVSVPVGMMTPPDVLVQNITRQLLENARESRFQLTEQASKPAMPTADALSQIGKGNGQG